jgi:hypothetical protein
MPRFRHSSWALVLAFAGAAACTLEREGTITPSPWGPPSDPDPGASASSGSGGANASSSSATGSASVGAGGAGPGVNCGADTCAKLCCVQQSGAEGQPPVAQFCSNPSCPVLKIRCDGPEDCTGGAACCGDYVEGLWIYTAIQCGPCSNAGQYPICHHGFGDGGCPAGKTCKEEPLLGPGYGYCE